MNTTIRLVFCCALAGSGAAHALELYNGERGTLNFNFEATAAPLYSSFNYGKRQSDSVKWMESYIRSGFSGETSAVGGTAYGTVSMMTSKVFGDGDAAGTSTGDEARTDFDQAFAGWKNDWLDLSAGRQTYVMGDSFLIAGDQLAYGDNLGNGFDRGGLYYLAQRTSFAQTAVARLRLREDLLVEAFHLESNNNGQGSPTLNGVNTEYAPDAGNLIGAAYFKVDKVDTQRAGGLFALREDLDVYNLRGKTNLGIEALSLEAGYAKERSSDVDADAWYAGIYYQFAEAALTPSLGYRYSRFSGDDPESRKSEAFDPLFYGAALGDPAWVQGEIAGTFAGPFNTNARVHRLSGRAVLSEQVAFSAMAYRFETDQGSEHFADELDLYLETFPTANLAIIPVVGFWKPQQGAQAIYGQDDVQTFVALITSITF
ncbi:TPA: hypothetical protein ACNIGS_001532 [Pseudomonas aeruginosa]